MNIRPPDTRYPILKARAVLSLSALAVLLLSFSANALAQRTITKKYPAQRNVRFEMKNISGSITIEAWEKNIIEVAATVYSPAAQFTPEQTEGCVGIDVVRDNRGRMVGDINFRIKVPVNSTVNIETKRGNISINNIRGDMVRAHVSTSGDVELTGLRANQVIAESGMGNIFYDGELTGGTYTFKSLSGDITIRIPANSSFNLVANGQAQSIDLNVFASPGLSFVGDGRKVYGNVDRGAGPRSSLVIFNQRGRISFLGR
ncbi:MAG TPA: DUF4097 family beta strand repeat-containing protein [Pyrinomonadaceae bacterium]|nr:DUF4097 family beta strand repeat-containing protein [Pyrinomonadaceae bacterium]